MITITEKEKEVFISYNSYDYWQLKLNCLVYGFLILSIIVRLIVFKQKEGIFFIKFFGYISVITLFLGNILEYLCGKNIIFDKVNKKLIVITNEKTEYKYSEIKYIKIAEMKNKGPEIMSYELTINDKEKLFTIHLEANLDVIRNVFINNGFEVKYEKAWYSYKG